MNELLKKIANQLTQYLQTKMEYRAHRPLSGGDINQVFLLKTTERGRFFVKINKASRLDMFLAEHAALEEIRESNTLQTPEPILAGVVGNHAFLVMEFIDMGAGTPRSEEALGHGLARMHQITKPVGSTAPATFGWYRNNTIGSTRQINQQEQSWGIFWREHRIGPQLRWAAERGASSTLLQKGEQLLTEIEPLLETGSPIPSLLHGDLWSGNWSTAKSGEPVIYDPALYYGDREADLAMTELFGGFSSRFYSAYSEIWLLEDGYNWRKNLYNLYHILNHFNLFGGDYGRQAERIVDTILPGS